MYVLTCLLAAIALGFFLGCIALHDKRKAETERADENYADYCSLSKKLGEVVNKRDLFLAERNNARKELSELRISLGKLAHPGAKEVQEAFCKTSAK